MEGKISQERIDELNSLGFILDANEYVWLEGITHLKRFIEREGHVLVPQPHEEDGFRLGSWVQTRRQEYKRGILAQEQIDELNRLGFIWDVREYRRSINKP